MPIYTYNHNLSQNPYGYHHPGQAFHRPGFCTNPYQEWTPPFQPPQSYIPRPAPAMVTPDLENDYNPNYVPAPLLPYGYAPPIARQIPHQHAPPSRSIPPNLIHACPRHTLYLHIYTYGSSYGRPIPPSHEPILGAYDLSRLQCPTKPLLDRYTGLHKQIHDAFFAIEANEAFYCKLMSNVKNRLVRALRAGAGGSVAVLVNCRAGMHRSVAVGERLRRSVRKDFGGRGVVVAGRHLDLWRGEEKIERRRREGYFGREGERRSRREIDIYGGVE